MSDNWIDRIIENAPLPTERVKLPEGHGPCGLCHGRGMCSKYDEGWSSLMHDPELAALHRCPRCGGQGHHPAGPVGGSDDATGVR